VRGHARAATPPSMHALVGWVLAPSAGSAMAELEPSCHLVRRGEVEQHDDCGGERPKRRATKRGREHEGRGRVAPGGFRERGGGEEAEDQEEGSGGNGVGGESKREVSVSVWRWSGRRARTPHSGPT
jgi:hypothetical protein